MKKILIVASTLALAACGGAATDEAAEGEAGGGAAAAPDVTMQAGKWSNTMVIESFEMPGAPPEAAGLFESMVGQERTSEQCLTQEEIDENLQEMARGPMDNNEECTTEEFSIAGGTIKGRMTCSSPTGGKATINIDGSHSDSSMNMTMAMNAEDPQMPGGKMSMVMKMSGERVGDCDS